MPGVITPVPFSFFVSLCRELSKINPRSTRRGTPPPSSPDTEATSVKVFRRWVQELRRRFPRSPPGIAATLFLFLFPEEDVDRKYGMKEDKLAKELAGVFGVSMEDGNRGDGLKNWASALSGATSLGEQVYDLLCRSSSDNSLDDDSSDGLSIQDVNSMLDELASKSAFSASSLRNRHSSKPVRSRQQILQGVYRRLRPFDAAVLTQIILRDLRPILYPVDNVSATSSLLDFNSKATHVLTLHEAMRVWDPSGVLLRCYSVQATIEHSFRLFEKWPMSSISPQVGVPVQIPKCAKGQGCNDALKKFESSTSVWAETKYDGERTQIHVAVNEDGDSEITIFSKSKRVSTLDRIATHWIIREALGLKHTRPEEVCARARPHVHRRTPVSSVILEAEMVAYDEDVGIDEFWRIRELVEATAYGARRRSRDVWVTTSSESSRHLALVFFDMLYLNGTSLLLESYCSRRGTLEAIVRPIPMYAFLSSRVEISLSGGKRLGQGVKDLKRIFASSVANREEGLVLKAAEATYADWQLPWVKLKKDYIPGYGDAADLVLVGASWDKERGRILRVPTSTYTTFYVAAIDSSDQQSSQPHLEVLFTVSYGLDRKQLEELNFLIKSMDPIPYRKDMQGELPFSFNLTPGLPHPFVIFATPLLVEVFGAGFTKIDETEHYELRFPRISKVHRVNDRSWLEGVTLAEFNNMAYNAVRKDTCASDDGAIVSQAGVLSASARNRKRNSADFQAMRHGVLGGRDQKRCRVGENACSASISSQEKHSRPVAAIEESRVNMRSPLCLLTNCGSFPGVWLSQGRDSVPDDTRPIKVVMGATGIDNSQGGLICRVPADPAKKSSRQSFALFLQRAIILLDCGFRPQDYDSTFIDKFVLANVVHSFEAFALGCGWERLAGQKTYSAAEYGVVFVDDRSLQDWCETRPFTTVPPGLEKRRKPIFVFSSDCLLRKTLDGDVLNDESGVKGKCLAAYL